MKKSALTILFLLLVATSHSQGIKVISFEDLQNRYSQKNDTTYIVNFWATWCKPCVAELPYLDSLQKEFKEDKLRVLLVNLDFKSRLETTVKPFVKKKNIQSEVLLLNETDAGSYIDKVSANWSGAIPATLVVNGSRKINRFFEEEFTHQKLLKVYKETRLE